MLHNREDMGVGNGTSTISTNGTIGTTISQTSGDTSIAQRSGEGGKGKGSGSLQDFGVSGSLSPSAFNDGFDLFGLNNGVNSSGGFDLNGGRCFGLNNGFGLNSYGGFDLNSGGCF